MADLAWFGDSSGMRSDAAALSVMLTGEIVTGWVKGVLFGLLFGLSLSALGTEELGATVGMMETLLWAEVVVSDGSLWFAVLLVGNRLTLLLRFPRENRDGDDVLTLLSKLYAFVLSLLIDLE